MPNYYDILQIRGSASREEIEAAIDRQYNEWRRLVTHHDSNMAHQATQRLALLEQMRATLTDPAKRAGYDAAMGLAGQQVGGLADPAAMRQMPDAAAYGPPGANVSGYGGYQAPMQPADAWICPKCHAVNAIGKRFCSKCGQQLGADCPNCGKLTSVAEKFCAECGCNLEKALPVHREKVAVSQWLAQTQSYAGTMRYVATVRAVIANGSFQQVFGACADALSSFSFKLPPPFPPFRMTTKNMEANPQTGEVSGELSHAVTKPKKWTMKFFVQNEPALTSRGVVLVVTTNVDQKDITGRLSLIADPLIHSLIARNSGSALVG